MLKITEKNKSLLKKVAKKAGSLKIGALGFLMRFVRGRLLWIHGKLELKYGKTKRNLFYSVLLALFVAYQLPSIVWHLKHSSVTFVMEGRERIQTTDGSDRYEIYTSEGLFHNHNSLIRMKKNASMLQSNLKFGATYTCSVQGYHSVLLKRVRNIVRCEEIKPNTSYR